MEVFGQNNPESRVKTSGHGVDWSAFGVHRGEHLVASDREHMQSLEARGFTRLVQPFSPAFIDTLTAEVEELWRLEGLQSGRENSYREDSVRRLANLAAKGPVFTECFMEPQVLRLGRQLVNDSLHLSMLNARDPLPGSTRQAYHRDCDDGHHPDQKGFFSVTAIIMLDDFTVENGGTLVVPGSHQFGTFPQDEMADLTAPHPDEIFSCGARGDVLLINGHLWHAGGANFSDTSRRSILVHYYAGRIERVGRFRPAIAPDQRADFSEDALEVLGLDKP